MESDIDFQIVFHEFQHEIAQAQTNLQLFNDIVRISQ